MKNIHKQKDWRYTCQNINNGFIFFVTFYAFWKFEEGKKKKEPQTHCNYNQTQK